MSKPLLLSIVTFVAVVAVIATLAIVTQDEAPDCASGRDVSAAVLADAEGDQDAMVNRAIIVRGKCEQDEKN
ncbi:hypothetical protein [Parahaliea aestuarii]|uniref:Uncharacterized protein n=1 Tax=Parahaliea aestuarii TaxID=1852021 RepID=A0A5C8ZV62_9GAMM|nr:hypothetical protein [Parahaliea aestuarii]TXS91161.1 hypothetical protein FVW59_13240 [Parahaliea aestuarii]